MDIGLKREVTLELRGDRTVPNLTVCVAAYTAAGDGPWSLPVPLEPWRPGNSTVLLSPLQPVRKDPVSPRYPYLLPVPFSVTYPNPGSFPTRNLTESLTHVTPVLPL